MVGRFERDFETERAATASRPVVMVSILKLLKNCTVQDNRQCSTGPKEGWQSFFEGGGGATEGQLEKKKIDFFRRQGRKASDPHPVQFVRDSCTSTWMQYVVCMLLLSLIGIVEV